MANKSAIEWTESTWNPITGCDKISAGCLNCYAERMARRLMAMGSPNYSNGFKLTTHKEVLSLPLKWKKPQIVFVNSMSDLFHKDVPDSFIMEVFDVMNKASWHKFQILTKRPERLKSLDKKLRWADNILMGVTVENNDYKGRIDILRNTGAYIKFISFEPLIGHIADVDLNGIDWAIVGGESGYGARPIEKKWVIDLKTQCKRQRVPFFFKQWGGMNKKENGRKLQGRTYSEVPQVLQFAF
jgi:protein gp37